MKNSLENTNIPRGFEIINSKKAKLENGCLQFLRRCGILIPCDYHLKGAAHEQDLHS